MFGERPAIGETPLWPAGPSQARAGQVYVVEDDAALARTILRALHGAGLVGHCYHRAADFLELAHQLPPGCLVTDLKMPGMDGLELIRRVRAAGLPFRAILITGHADVQIAVDCMKAGACDFVEKPFAPEILLQAVARVLATDAAGPGAEARWLAAVTPRERQVLEALVSGATNKVIARRLSISARTVEAHRASLMRKCRAATFAELMRRALLAGVREHQPRGGYQLECECQNRTAPSSS